MKYYDNHQPNVAASILPVSPVPTRQLMNEHGGGAKGVNGCTCEPCVEKKREYNRKYMRRQRAR